jgi:hypothetical protein
MWQPDWLVVPWVVVPPRDVSGGQVSFESGQAAELRRLATWGTTRRDAIRTTIEASDHAPWRVCSGSRYRSPSPLANKEHRQLDLGSLLMPLKPIVLDYRGDLVVCPSLSRAEEYLEPDDVGSVDVYDADGRLLRASVAGSWPNLRTRIEELPGAITAEERLRSVLLSFLRACGERTIPDDAPLETLVTRAGTLAPDRR